MSLWRGWVLLIWILDYLTWTNALMNEKGESPSDGGPVRAALPEEVFSSDTDWKRSHNIMRFGKRTLTGREDIDAKKRGSESSKHSFVYFGKRSDTSSTFPDLLQYLRANQEKDSWKRGHNIMRFGKRKENHNFIHFGKRPYEPTNVYHLLRSHSAGNSGLNSQENTPETKKIHSVMYFGKRGGHSMMYFGKRGEHSLLHFGKRFPEEAEVISDAKNRQNSLVEDDGSYSESENEKRASHNIIRFGKRFDDTITKKAHSIIHFGKRFGDIKKTHSMIHFGKRDQIDDNLSSIPSEHHILLYREAESADNTKRAPHSMIHFGKRDELPYEVQVTEEILDDITNKRAPHAMIHFGKRDDADGDINSDLSPTKMYHSAMHFGKRLDSNSGIAEDKRNHAMIHFGKRSEDSKGGSHAMIHFGKRNWGNEEEVARHVNKRSNDKNWPFNGLFHTPAIKAINEANSIEPNVSPLKNSTKISKSNSPNEISKMKDTNRHKREAISIDEPLENIFPLPGYDFMVKIKSNPGFSHEMSKLDNNIEDIDRTELFEIGTNPEYQFLPSRQIRSDFLSELINYRRPYKKENAKNVFLHFGKR